MDVFVTPCRCRLVIELDSHACGTLVSRKIRAAVRTCGIPVAKSRHYDDQGPGSGQTFALFVDFDRVTDWRQPGLAGTAFANIGKVLGGNPIGPTARRAISNQRHGSILGPQSGEHWHTFGTPTPRKTQENCTFRVSRSQSPPIHCPTQVRNSDRHRTPNAHKA